MADKALGGPRRRGPARRSRAGGAGVPAPMPGPGGLRRQLIGWGLPADILLDQPRLVLLGSLELTVENHRGLREFSPGHLVLAVPGGLVVVEGEGLSLDVLRPGELTVRGRLRGVRFAPSGGAEG